MVDNWPVKFSTRLLRDDYSIMPVDEWYPEDVAVDAAHPKGSLYRSGISLARP
jgi:hypothetical protein